MPQHANRSIDEIVPTGIVSSRFNEGEEMAVGDLSSASVGSRVGLLLPFILSSPWQLDFHRAA